jgi:hypothetical protein
MRPSKLPAGRDECDDGPDCRPRPQRPPVTLGPLCVERESAFVSLVYAQYALASEGEERSYG